MRADKPALLLDHLGNVTRANSLSLLIWIGLSTANDQPRDQATVHFLELLLKPQNLAMILAPGEENIPFLREQWWFATRFDETNSPLVLRFKRALNSLFEHEFSESLNCTSSPSRQRAIPLTVLLIVPPDHTQHWLQFNVERTPVIDERTCNKVGWLLTFHARNADTREKIATLSHYSSSDFSHNASAVNSKKKAADVRLAESPEDVATNIRSEIGERSYRMLVDLPLQKRLAWLGELFPELPRLSIEEQVGTLRQVLQSGSPEEQYRLLMQKTEEPNEVLLTVKEFAQRLDVSPDGIWRYIMKGDLEPVQIGSRLFLSPKELRKLEVTPKGRLRLTSSTTR